MNSNRQINPFPVRLISRSFINSNISKNVLKEWTAFVELVLGSLIFIETNRHKMLCLFYHYRHFNDIDLTNLSCIDLLIHKIRIKSDTKSANIITQKRWSVHIEWWLRKIITDGMKNEIYEFIESANGRLSRWNVKIVVMNKIENSTSKNESKVTFDYSRVNEKLSNSHFELSSKVHDNLSDSRHRCLFAANLKHAYLTISFHSDDKHYFVFTIFDIDQIQFIRMQQNSQSADFTMTELTYRDFDSLFFLIKKLSLLHSNDSASLSMLTFYMNDFFDEFASFEKQYVFLKKHFLSRVEWTRLLLSFKKLQLFVEKIRTLNVIHSVDDFVRILKKRIVKIVRWSVSKNQFDVRDFLNIVNIIKRWIKNFTELTRSFTRLTDKVEWRWQESEQLFFEMLRIKCVIKSNMHDINLCLIVHFYIDVSDFAVELVIIQFQSIDTVNTTAINNKAIEISIFYDSFALSFIRRKYSIYKRELYDIVTFVTKYDYLCKHFFLPVVIHTNHRSFVHFLKNDLHENIYGHWANQLRRLNIIIQYISGHRNKIVDVLSRILFDVDCNNNNTISQLHEKITNRDFSWVWKDDKKNFDEFLAFLNSTHKSETLEHDIIDDLSVFSFTAMTHTDANWQDAYSKSTWFDAIYRFFVKQNETSTAITIRLSFDYQMITNILWIHRREYYLSCIFETKIRDVLVDVHDNNDHWAKTNILTRLRNKCYWSDQAQNVKRYIAECIDCAKHDPITRSQSFNSVFVTSSFQLCDMNFIEFFDEIISDCRYIFMIVCYFNRFIVFFVCKNNNVENVLWCLRLFFAMYRRSYVFYVNSDQHFNNSILRDFFHGENTVIEYSSSNSFKFTDMIKLSNKLFEKMLRKNHFDVNWNYRISVVAKSVNSRTIDYLEINLTDINFGIVFEASVIISILLGLPERDVKIWHDELTTPITHANHVKKYFQYRAKLHDIVREITRRRREAETRRYNKGIRQIIHQTNSLVMLYQKTFDKLQSRWRGSFQIIGYENTHEFSFTLRQPATGRDIRGTFHENYLKTFTSRTGYLSNSTLDQYEPDQTIRRPRRQQRRT